MQKIKVGIIFGGRSSEYDVSLVSASSVIENISREKYDLVLIGITKEGDFYLYEGDEVKIKDNSWLNDKKRKITFSCNYSDKGIITLDNNELIKLDIVFPVLHGQNGEDGRLQGMLELAGIKYVGCDMLSSALGMDKYLAHELVSSCGILAPISYLFSEDDDIETIKNKIINLKYPLFVKPLKAGSSFGISKIASAEELEKALNEAFKYDNKVIIEENIDGFEVGCAIIGNKDLDIGEVDEIELKEGFFDYFEKYNLKESKIHLPARVAKEEREKIKNIALQIYKILGCKGLARVDMFYTKDKKIVFNEVNTLPGFTSHSRYPSMLKMNNYSFEMIIDKLIQLGLE